MFEDIPGMLEEYRHTVKEDFPALHEDSRKALDASRKGFVFLGLQFEFEV